MAAGEPQVITASPDGAVSEGIWLPLSDDRSRCARSYVRTGNTMGKGLARAWQSAGRWSHHRVGYEAWYAGYID